MEEQSTVVRLQPQSGLGDLIQLLPTIETAIERGIKIIVATNHGYVLKPYGNTVETVPVESVPKDDWFKPVPIDGFMQLKYTRYGQDTYADRYYKTVFPDGDYVLSVDAARARYEVAATERLPFRQYVVFAPPRAAERHKKSISPFQCAPDWNFALSRARDLSVTLLTVGQDDLYEPIPEGTLSEFLDLRDCLTFWELCAVIMRAARVVSQIGAITTLAGLYGVPTDFLPARTECEEHHNKHVAGVVWPGQEIIK